jgi:hypothetical protein
MKDLSPNSLWRRVVLDRKNRDRDRAEALSKMPRPSMNLLEQLLRDQNTGKKLRIVATELYAAGVTARQHRRIERAAKATGPKDLLG